MITPEKFQRKPFFVDAVRVTEENAKDVAQWCLGNLVEAEDGRHHIKVRVHHPLNERQTKAFIGDWILYASKGFKVYTNKAFNNNFESVFTEEAADVK